MKAYKVTNIIFDEIKSPNDLPKINESKCDDFLSQLIFFKIDQYSFSMCGSVHNAIFNNREILPYIILCLEDEISNQNLPSVSVEDITNALDNTNKIFTPPNYEFKEVVTMKTFPKKANINGQVSKIHFNPYLLALYMSDIYFTLYNDQRIQDWCEQGQIKFESVDKVFEIIEDKYSYRFVDLTKITFNTLYKVIELDKGQKLARLNEFYGFKGTDLMRHYATWSNTFYIELLGVIQGFFGKLKYS